MRAFILLLVVGSMAGCATAIGTDASKLSRLENYDAVMVDPVNVIFAEDYHPRLPNSRSPVSDRDLERLKADIAGAFDARFAEALADSGVALVDEPGDRVLRITPELQDVRVGTPVPDAIVGEILSRSAGEARLVAAFSDSRSGEVHILFTDQQYVRQPQEFERVTNFYNSNRFGFLFSDWGQLIGQRLAGENYAAN